MLLNQKVDPLENVQITLGAVEALYASIFGLVNPGEEIIIIEPFYELYTTYTRAANACRVYVPLRRQQKDGQMYFNLDLNELESKFSDKTKMIIINTPHNPTGKVSECSN